MQIKHVASMTHANARNSQVFSNKHYGLEAAATIEGGLANFHDFEQGKNTVRPVPWAEIKDGGERGGKNFYDAYTKDICRENIFAGGLPADYTSRLRNLRRPTDEVDHIVLSFTKTEWEEMTPAQKVGYKDAMRATFNYPDPKYHNLPEGQPRRIVFNTAPHEDLGQGYVHIHFLVVRQPVSLETKQVLPGIALSDNNKLAHEAGVFKQACISYGMPEPRVEVYNSVGDSVNQHRISQDQVNAILAEKAVEAGVQPTLEQVEGQKNVQMREEILQAQEKALPTFQRLEEFAAAADAQIKTKGKVAAALDKEIKDTMLLQAGLQEAQKVLAERDSLLAATKAAQDRASSAERDLVETKDALAVEKEKVAALESNLAEKENSISERETKNVELTQELELVRDAEKEARQRFEAMQAEKIDLESKYKEIVDNHFKQSEDIKTLQTTNKDLSQQTARLPEIEKTVKEQQRELEMMKTQLAAQQEINRQQADLIKNQNQMLAQERGREQVPEKAQERGREQVPEKAQEQKPEKAQGREETKGAQPAQKQPAQKQPEQKQPTQRASWEPKEESQQSVEKRVEKLEESRKADEAAQQQEEERKPQDPQR